MVQFCAVGVCLFQSSFLFILCLHALVCWLLIFLLIGLWLYFLFHMVMLNYRKHWLFCMFFFLHFSKVFPFRGWWWLIMNHQGNKIWGLYYCFMDPSFAFLTLFRCRCWNSRTLFTTSDYEFSPCYVPWVNCTWQRLLMDFNYTRYSYNLLKGICDDWYWSIRIIELRVYVLVYEPLLLSFQLSSVAVIEICVDLLFWIMNSPFGLSLCVE